MDENTMFESDCIETLKREEAIKKSQLKLINEIMDGSVERISCENGILKCEKKWEKWESKDGQIWTIVESDSQTKINQICDSMKNLLLYKNEKYGDSALNPNNIFYKGDSTNSIKIRLDDKIGRVKNSDEIRVNDVCDIIGYCVLLLVSMGVSEKDIENLKD